MAITTRSGKGSPLTNTEMDTNLKQIPNGSDSSITDTGSKVGIGTDNPQKLLEISSNDDPTIRIHNTRSDTDWVNNPNFGTLEFNSADSSGFGVGIKASIKATGDGNAYGGYSALEFHTSDYNANENMRMKIDAHGNVGIGTDNVRGALHIKPSSNDWENSLLLEHNSGNTGWNIHPENNAENALWFGYNTDTSASLVGQNATARMVIDGLSGNVKVNTGNLVIGTSGKGIDFSANANASGMTSEVLDDYEEGTWTPVTNQGTNSSVGGSYTKIGRLVDIKFQIDGNNDSTTNTVIEITGLPFTVGNYLANTSHEGHGSVSYPANLIGTNLMGCYVTGANAIELTRSDTAGSVTYANASGSWSIRGSLTYFA